MGAITKKEAIARLETEIKCLSSIKTRLCFGISCFECDKNVDPDNIIEAMQFAVDVLKEDRDSHEN